MKDDEERKPEEKKSKEFFQNIHPRILRAVENNSTSLDLRDRTGDYISWKAPYFTTESVEFLLNGCPNLVSITGRLDVESIKHLGKFTKLQRLHIGGIYHNLEEFSLILPFLQNLIYLTLENVYSLNNQFHTILSKLPELQFLDFFDFEAMRIEDFYHLSNLKQLIGLRIEESSLDPREQKPINNDKLKSFLRSQDFKYLELTYSFSICDNAANLISSLNNLQTLICNVFEMTDKGFTYFQKIKNLKTLHLGSCINITDQGFRTLSSMPLLEELSLEGCHQLKDKGLEAILSLKNLKTLQLDFCSGVSDAGWSQLKNLVNLEKLTLDFCGITNLGNFQNFPRLKKLRICGKTISEENFKNLTKASELKIIPKD